jgi:hypothetical protein
MSTEIVNNSASASAAVAASNQEVWDLLMDMSNVKDECVEKITKTLFDSGIKSTDDLDIIANIPKLVRSIANCLKDVPAKKFTSEMNSRSVTSKAPFCPVCRDAGLSAEEYTSHHIWSDESRETVICPTLLAHTCEKCGETGHMPRYCSATRNVTIRKPREPLVVVEKEKPKHCKVCYQAGFSADVYSSHFTKVDDQILCPTILNNTCHRCGKKGHTTKYCTITVRDDFPPLPVTQRRKPSRFEPPAVTVAPTTTESNPAPIPLPSYIPPTNPVTQFKPIRILSRKEPLPKQPAFSPLSIKEIANKYGDQRYEHDEHGRPEGLTVWATDYRPPMPISYTTSQEILLLATQLLERAKNTKYTEERNCLIALSIQYQQFIINYPNNF